jgi:hypothetical protein
MLEKIRVMSSRRLFHKPGICSRTLLVVVTVAAVTFTPRVALPELRPIILDMLENLGEIDDIGAALSVDDFGRVAEAARSLQSRASAMKVHGEAPPELDKQHAPAWDDFLTAQETTALAVLTAANEENGDAVMRGVEAMFRDSCIACHAVSGACPSAISPSLAAGPANSRRWQRRSRGTR